MTRDSAYHILVKHLSNPVLIFHSFFVEATMRALSRKFASDTDEWGITGLLHDADYEKAKGNPDKHGILLFQLEPNAIPQRIEHAIKSHNFTYTHVAPESPMDFGLYCCDELTGIIAECTQLTENKNLSQLTPELVIQKLENQHFAKGAEKEKIFLCEEKLGIPMPEFVAITLQAMQEVEEGLKK